MLIGSVSSHSAYFGFSSCWQIWICKINFIFYWKWPEKAVFPSASVQPALRLSVFRWTLQAEELRSPADGTLAFTLWAPWMSVKKSSLHPGPVRWTDWCWHSHHGEEHQESGWRLLLWRAKDQKTNVDVYQEGQSFFFFERVFSPKTDKIHKNLFDLWRISIIRLKYKDNNNRKQCGRRRWTWQEVASYLRLQPILWQILSEPQTDDLPVWR